MNKMFKGAVAGAAGVALLLGGAGTFALWNDAASIGEDKTIVGGHLTFGDEMPAGVWYYGETGTTEVDPAELAWVPGDVVRYVVEDVPVIAHGDHLAAELGVDWSGLEAATADEDDYTDADASTKLLNALDIEYAVDGQATDTIVSITGTTDMTATNHDITVKITFDPETANLDGAGGQVDLSGIKLTLTQVPTEGQVGYQS
jgi:alternate signal-mediated exported protein